MRENYHRVPKIRENRFPRIREIGSLQIRTGLLTFSFTIFILAHIALPHKMNSGLA